MEIQNIVKSAVTVWVFDTHEKRVPQAVISDTAFRKNGKPDKRFRNLKLTAWLKANK